MAPIKKKETNNKPAKGKKSKAVTHFFVRVITGASVVAVLFLWASAASPLVAPDTFGVLPFLGLMFPLFLVGTAVMLLITLLFARSRCWIPLLGMACCCMSIRQYCPINIPSPAPKKSLKIMSFNVMSFNDTNRGADGRNQTLKYISRSGADIVCIQEGTPFGNTWKEMHSVPFTRALPYCDTLCNNFEHSNILICFSRFPIVKKHAICRSRTNGAAVFYVLIAPHDTLRVINCHFESNRLSAEERTTYSAMVHEPDADVLQKGRAKKSIFRKFRESAKIRAWEVDSVVNYIHRYRNQSMVLCGDFNDTPISYARHSIASLLTDAYVTTGNGPGRSFNRDAIFVRIDNIFMSDDWKPYACHVERQAGHLSDHYPIVCNIKRKSSERK